MLLKKKLNIKKKKRKETERRSGSQTSRLRGEAVSIAPSMLTGGRPEQIIWITRDFLNQRPEKKGKKGIL